MSARIIPFRDPAAPVEGEAREIALAAYQESLPAIVSKAIGSAFVAAARAPGAGDLGCEDVLPYFVAEIRRQLDERAGAPVD